jgi:hypothetical protein
MQQRVVEDSHRKPSQDAAAEEPKSRGHGQVPGLGPPAGTEGPIERQMGEDFEEKFEEALEEEDEDLFYPR